ncbi:MAG: hypothetical protein DDT22_01343 [candidate division WS2 bacterium]|nr:hypothetical protein [Candidatus Lithacetigena glycinireducens]MBT9175659.1 hypothetical protein [Candidatus Lithacetigena glycinireducens]
MDTGLKDFSLAIFRFSFNPSEEIWLPPYKGSAFRGVFGSVFKRVVCISSEKVCKSCLLNFRCVYSYTFETPIDGKVKFNTTHLPHPYVIEPPLEEKTLYLPGEYFSLNLILIGNAIEYLPYFVFVMERLGENRIGKRRGRFFLERVENLPHPSDEKGRIIYELKSKRLLADIEIKKPFETGGELQENNSNTLTLHFLTPTRITYRNRLCGPLEFNFSVFIKNILRRIALLTYHCGTELQIDYKDLLIQAENIQMQESSLYWYDWQRYSTRQNTRMKLGGFKGKVVFKGNILPFLPFIKCGEYIHIGKDTSFGLGKYIIEFVEGKQ